MALVLSVCDHVYVLDFGHVIAEGPPEAIGSNQVVIDAYLGSSHSALTEEILTGHVPTVAEVEQLVEGVDDV